MTKKVIAERLDVDTSPEMAALATQVAHAVAAQLNPLTGVGRGKLVSFRLFAVISAGDETFRTVALAGTTEEAVETQAALDTMLDYVQGKHKTEEPSGHFKLDAPGRH